MHLVKDIFVRSFQSVSYNISLREACTLTKRCSVRVRLDDKKRCSSHKNTHSEKREDVEYRRVRIEDRRMDRIWNIEYGNIGILALA